MKKQPRGASSDRVRYLGDLSALQFLKDKISIEGGSEKMFLGGQKIKRFGQEIVLMEDNDETEDPAPFWFTDSLSPGRSIHHWIYSVSGVDRHTSDRLLKMYVSSPIIHPKERERTLMMREKKILCKHSPSSAGSQQGGIPEAIPRSSRHLSCCRLVERHVWCCGSLCRV